MFVYKITNLINEKAYIGLTKETVAQRFARHLGRDRHSRCYALQAAFAKYGKDNFKIETLYEADSYEEMKCVEKGLIAQYGTMSPNGYNLTAGGEGGLGYRHSDAMKKHMSEIKIGKNTWSKGRDLHSHKIAQKLTDAEVRRIKMFHLTGMRNAELSKIFDVDRHTISSITKSRTYTHVNLEIV